VEPLDLTTWLRAQCAAYRFDVKALYRSRPDETRPLLTSSGAELDAMLDARGHFLPLPKEPAALANIVEVSVCDHLVERAREIEGLTVERGTERGYPDLEFGGPALGDAFHAVDIKVARRKATKSGRQSTQTQSRITLYTGNTYFRYPKLQWPGTFRPFDDYGLHLDVLCIYDLSDSNARVADLETIVQEAWRIGSRQRSSTTREYIGAVQKLADLREGRGEFPTADAFYAFWRRYNFRVGKVVQQQLDKIIREAGAS
jgi:Restriction endonuclease EcoRV